LPARQASEQYRTFSQSRDHFFRQLKGRPQWAQSLVGRSAFLRILGMGCHVARAARGCNRAVIEAR
jgi:hypothetical protein